MWNLSEPGLFATATGVSKLTASTYKLYGLQIRSEIPLPAPVADGSGDIFDIEVIWGERRSAPREASPGEVIASFSFGSNSGYTHVADDSGFTLRFNGTGEFRLDRQLKCIRVHLAPGQKDELAAWLLAGNVIATLLTLSGDCVLHASAVEVDGNAVAFVGHSGMGKSTLAALLCSAGARLVTDDLLRVAFKEGVAYGHQGTKAIRLRPEAAALCADWPPASLRSSVDGRRMVEVELCAEACPPLSAIIVPQRSRTASEVQLNLLPMPRAIYVLSAYPRVAGWRSGDVIARQFQLLGRLVKSVSVYEAVVPWGPPFAPDLGNRLLDGVRSALGCPNPA